MLRWVVTSDRNYLYESENFHLEITVIKLCASEGNGINFNKQFSKMIHFRDCMYEFCIYNLIIYISILIIIPHGNDVSEHFMLKFNQIPLFKLIYKCFRLAKYT